MFVDVDHLGYWNPEKKDCWCWYFDSLSGSHLQWSQVTIAKVVVSQHHHPSLDCT